ncbi:MAG TPA: type I-U CRISPR-associated protein Csx17 [Sandaracinaceae bacterium LLY-WYZ-13_1]|nr:type I-U CRISPR-associated protein Csx17 [Sandaracinaceae bacterium LLY-WYZ-13_1]
MSEIALEGLARPVLASYLSALGVFRAVASQLDAGATLRFDRDLPVLEVPSLANTDELLDWVWTSYEPSPIASPWNSGAGFFGKSKAVDCADGEKRNGVELVLASSDARLSRFRGVLELEQTTIAQTGYPDALDKVDLLRFLRGRLPDAALDWLDAVVVLEGDEPGYIGLLGTGGNDGRLDLGNNFMLRLASLLPFEGNLLERSHAGDERSRALLAACLLGARAEGLDVDSAGQFAPASRAAPNGSSGRSSFVSKKLSNPWTFIWALEGSLWFGGASTRRLGSHGRARAAFPFHADRVAAGFGTASDIESGRVELWLPQWELPATSAELAAYFGEARAQVGRRRASSGLDYARAIGALAELRGALRFQRYSILERAGQSQIAVSVGSYAAGAAPARMELLRSIDGWLRSYDRLRSAKNAPPRYAEAYRRFETAVMGLARADEPERMVELLASLGSMERELARAPELVASEGALRRVRPLRLESTGWLDGCLDVSVELRLAVALASIDSRRPLGPLRAYLEGSSRTPWKDPRVRNAATLGVVDLATELLDRRLLERHEIDASDRAAAAPAGGLYGAGLSDLAAFIAERTRDPLLESLVWAAAALDRDSLREAVRGAERPEGEALGWLDLPRYLAPIREVVAGVRFPLRSARDEMPTGDADAPVEPAAFRLLRAGRANDALLRALHRLRVSGIETLPMGVERRPRRSETARVTAALAFPLSRSAHWHLASSFVARPDRASSTQETSP